MIMNIPNFQTDSDYEYTDEDFVRDTQPCWQEYEIKLISKSSIADRRAEILRQLAELDSMDDENAEEVDDSNNEERQEADAVHRRWHEIDEAYRAATGIYPWEEGRRLEERERQQREEEAAYDRDAYLRGQSDYEFDMLDENRTPDGWPEFFDED